MAQNIQLKRSALPGKVPDTGSLNLGEIAINTYDGKVFLKKSGSIESVESIVTTNSINTGSITLTKTGSFGELVITQDVNIQRDLYIANDIIGNGDIDVLGNITGSNLLIKGTLTAQSYIVSSSVVNMTTQFASGSTVFGNTSDDTHQFTGSINITGSGYINSNRIITSADTGSFGASGGSYPVSGVDYDTDTVTVVDFNNESPQYLIDYLYEVPVGTQVGLKGFLGNTSGSTLVVPANDYIAFVINDTQVARVTADGFEGVSLPNGLISGSSQLTGSYDTRYVISGSITQTTWDNIASKPSGIVSSSVQVLGGTNIVSGSSQITPLLPTGVVSGSVQTILNLPTGVVSGSSQITYASISSIPAGIVSGSSQITPLLPTGVISGSSQLSGTTITNLTIQNLTTINETASVIFSSGSNRFGDFGDDVHSFTGSVQITGSITTIGSSTATSFNGAINATNGVISGSSQITASLDIRYALSGSAGAGPSAVLDSRSRYLSQSSAATTWSFTHNIGSDYPMVTVYGSNNEIIQPQYVKTLSSNQTEIGFGTPVSGVAVASLGSLTEVTGRTIRQDFTSSISWSFVHNVGDKYVMVQAFDTTDQMILPAEIRLASTTSSILTFTEPVSGYALATIGGDLPSISSSYEGYTLQVQSGNAVWTSIISASVSNTVTASYVLPSGLPTGVISGSSQLTASYDTRYVVSGSITQTTWDNIASKPGGIVSGSIQILGGTGIVSSSTQIKNYGDFVTTGSNSFIGNQNISGTIFLTGSIIPNADNTYDLGSSTKSFRHLYVSSGSIYMNGTKVLSSTAQELQFTTDVGQSIKILEAGSDTITLQSADGNITLASSGNGDVVLDPTNGVIGLKGTTTLYTGNKIVSSDGYAIQIGNDLGITGSLTTTTGNINGINLTTFSSSIASTFNTVQSNTSSLTNRLNNIETFSSSVLGHITDINTKTGSFETKFSTLQTLTASVQSQISRIQESTASLNTFSSSVESKNVTIANYTASMNTFTASNGNTSLNAATSSYAKTNTSNIFSADQTITGSLYISANLVVQGSSSIQTISSSTLNIGTNLITVNTLNPSARFGGLSSIDSGSTGLSGSILFDSITNQWIFQHQAVSGAASTSSIFITGPETSNALGSETTLTTNRIPKIKNDAHLNDSNITDDGTTISLNSNTVVTGSIIATSFTGSIGATNGVISGSSQVNFTQLSGISNGIVSGSTQTIANLPTGTVSGSAQVVGILSSLNTYTGSNDTKWSTLQTLTASNSASLNQINSVTASLNTYTSSNDTKWSTLQTLTASNSASIGQINSVTASLNAATSSYETKGRGIVSGSSQIDVMSTTNIAKLATTGSNTFTGNQSITGSLIIGAAASTLPLNVYTSSANVNNVIAEFYNGDYTSGTKNFIRVRNNVSVGSTYSSYFGQGQDGNTYIVSNDFTRGGDIVINANTGKTTIKTGLDVTGSVYASGHSRFHTGTTYSVGIAGSSGGNAGIGTIGDANFNIYGSSTSNVVIRTGASWDSTGVSTLGTDRLIIENGGTVRPGANGTQNLGSTSYAWANIYTNDLHLSNEGKPKGNNVDGTTGNWTIQEGAEHLYIINNKTGKKFKFSLEEIQ